LSSPADNRCLVEKPDESSFRPCAVVPVYNHEEPVVGVVAALKAAGLPVILVDDGCEERCAAVLRELSARSSCGQPGSERAGSEQAAVRLCVHTTNRGKGGAVKTALREASRLGFSHALQVDADGQHDLNDIARFLEAAREKP
jgi:glycosyltransferase involved in cell wall biosynthesis